MPPAGRRAATRVRGGCVPRVQRDNALNIDCFPAKDGLRIMSNRAVWTVRMKHEWLATPGKRKQLKKRKRVRVGLEAALLRKKKPEDSASAD